MGQLDPVTKKDDILENVYSGDIAPLDALAKIESSEQKPVKLKRAHFIKMNITLPNESKRLNIFLKTLFSIPLPMFLMRFGLKFASKKGTKAITEHVDDENAKANALEEVSDLEAYYDLIKYAKHSKVDIITDDAVIHIKII